MNNRASRTHKKLSREAVFYLSAAAVVLVLLAVAVGHHGYGAEHESVTGLFSGFVIAGILAMLLFGLLAIGAAICGAKDFALDTLGVISCVGNVFPVAFIACIATTLVPAGDVGIGRIFFVFLFILCFSHDEDYDAPFLRLFGCFLGEVGTIGFGLYFIPNPLLLFGIMVAGILFMGAAMYAPPPRWLSRSPKAEKEAE